MNSGFAAIVGLVTLAAVMATASVSRAQQAPQDSRLMFDPGVLQAKPKDPAAPPVKPNVRRAATPAAPRAPATNGQLRLSDSIDGTAASRRIRVQNPKPVPETHAGFGRVPLETGSFGFQTDTNAKSYELPDGTRMRGMDSNIKSSNTPSYFGLSLKVPTDSKVFAPFPSRAD